jgi:hypothetical protein
MIAHSKSSGGLFQQPVHPGRAFRGREQVLKNWSTVFSGVPDFQAELLRAAAEHDTVWAEWHNIRQFRNEASHPDMQTIVTPGGAIGHWVDVARNIDLPFGS